MARGKDERFNKNRNPKKPFETDEEAIDALMKSFPGSKLITTNDAGDEVVHSEENYQFKPEEMGEDAHLDMMYEDRYDLPYDDEGYNDF